MGTKNGIFSEQLQLMDEPDSEVLDSKPNKQETRLHALPVDTSNDLDRAQIVKKEHLDSLSSNVNGGAHFNIDTDDVSLKDHVNEETHLDEVPKKLKNDVDQHTSDACEEVIPVVVVKKEIKGSKSAQISQSDDHGSSLVPKKELDSVEQSRISDGGRTHAPSSLLKPQVESETRVSQFNQVCIIPSKDSSEKKQLVSYTGQGMDAWVSASPFDQETVKADNKTLYKLQPRRHHNDNGGHPLNSTPEIVSPVAADDGYNWRKYGQKLVKGNVFIRSYYKCTYSNCRAKKQVERSHDGPLTDIKYIGTHEHPRPFNPQSSSSPAQVTVTGLSVASISKAADEDDDDTVPPVEPPVTPRQGGSATPDIDHKEDGDSQVHNLQLSDGDGGSPGLKKQKRVNLCADDSTVKMTYCESRRIVQTRSEIDFINDGYRWRKYGQKLVKGNPNPRSYYRCTQAGCQAKKHVERASHDSKIVITTYEAKHDHDMPISKNGVNFTSMNTRESRSQLGEHNKPMEIDKAVGVGVQTD